MKKPFDSLLRRSGLFLSICKEDKSVSIFRTVDEIFERIFVLFIFFEKPN